MSGSESLDLISDSLLGFEEHYRKDEEFVELYNYFKFLPGSKNLEMTIQIRTHRFGFAPLFSLLGNKYRRGRLNLFHGINATNAKLN